MSVPTEHHISNVYLTSSDTNGESGLGIYGRSSAAGLPHSSCLGGPVGVNAPVIGIVNVVPQPRGESVVNEFIWAGDGI